MVWRDAVQRCAVRAGLPERWTPQHAGKYAPHLLELRVLPKSRCPEAQPRPAWRPPSQAGSHKRRTLLSPPPTNTHITRTGSHSQCWPHLHAPRQRQHGRVSPPINLLENLLQILCHMLHASNVVQGPPGPRACRRCARCRDPAADAARHTSPIAATPASSAALFARAIHAAGAVQAAKRVVSRQHAARLARHVVPEEASRLGAALGLGAAARPGRHGLSCEGIPAEPPHAAGRLGPHLANHVSAKRNKGDGGGERRLGEVCSCASREQRACEACWQPQHSFFHTTQHSLTSPPPASPPAPRRSTAVTPRRHISHTASRLTCKRIALLHRGCGLA